MSTIGQTAVTLQDFAKRVDCDGKVDKIVEIISLQNEILDDMLWMEGNLPTGHKTTVRTGLPGATWRQLNYGVQPTKSSTAQVTDTCGMLEAYAEVDKALADLNGNSSEFRLSEDKAFLEGMNQEMAKTLFYGNTAVNPERFMGLAPRFLASGVDPLASGFNVIKGGGSGSTNTSIWLVVWGDNTVHGIVPKGSKAGFQHEDKGQQTILDAAGGRFEGYRTHYKWDCGLTVRDWRYVVRIANVDVAALTKNAATGDDIVDLMTQALEKIPNLAAGRAAFYCNRTIRSFLRRQVVSKVASSTLSMDSVAGKKVVTLGEVPVRRVDQLLNTEATVS
jgi:hypothetical protein